jgi:hypothetical protein
MGQDPCFGGEAVKKFVSLTYLTKSVLQRGLSILYIHVLRSCPHVRTDPREVEGRHMPILNS